MTKEWLWMQASSCPNNTCWCSTAGEEKSFITLDPPRLFPRVLLIALLEQGLREKCHPSSCCHGGWIQNWNSVIFLQCLEWISNKKCKFSIRTRILKRRTLALHFILKWAFRLRQAIIMSDGFRFRERETEKGHGNVKMTSTIHEYSISVQLSPY